jgi:hypothetical protein
MALLERAVRRSNSIDIVRVIPVEPNDANRSNLSNSQHHPLFATGCLPDSCSQNEQEAHKSTLADKESKLEDKTLL